MYNKKTYGFTLAEVLITLGIIGVVASLTMPALIQNSKKTETSARLKKFYSLMEQAIIMSELANGNSLDWVKVETAFDEDGNTDFNAQGKITKEFFMQYLAPYLKYTSITEGKNLDSGTGTRTEVYLADGSSFSFNNGACMDFYFDVNGNSKPNEFGRDKFVFLMCFTKSKRLYYYGSENKSFGPYGENTKTREEALNRCKNNAFQCTPLLMFDNWEFKDDYPYRL